MKKLLTLLTALCLLVIPFVGCGETTGGGDDDKIDLSKFPKYVDPETAAYAFDFEQMTTPYFLGNVIYNETVLLSEQDGAIRGNLQYKPVKILSVRDYAWQNEYPASDYTVNGNTITMNAGGTMPYWEEGYFKGQDIPAPYREVTSITNVETDWVLMGASIYTEGSLIYGHQISVSYVYDVQDLKREEFASYQTSGMDKVKAKLSQGEDVKIVAIGDSVAEGCSSSAHFNREPFMENWVTQSTKALDAAYAGNVTVKNVAVGGKTSEWGAAAVQVNSIVKETPDLVIVHFGINDAGGNVTKGAYRDNMEKLIGDVQARVPNCEFLLVKAFTPNPLNYNARQFEQYWSALDAICESYEGVYTLDMYTPSVTMLQTKKYMDVTGNGINHVNDFSSRLYTMNILSALIKY